MFAMSHLQSAPLKVLLADTDYNEYLLLRELFSVDDDLCVGMLWCGECDQFYPAIQTGFYDLVLMRHCDESLSVLERVANNGCHTPVIMLTDGSCAAGMISNAKCGVLGVLDRQHPKLDSLKCFLQDAGLQPERLSHAVMEANVPGASSCRAGDSSVFQ
jgi:DNA-binding NtrC family response regulator